MLLLAIIPHETEPNVNVALGGLLGFVAGDLVGAMKARRQYWPADAEVGETQTTTTREKLTP